MAARSPIFDNVNPALVAAMEAFKARYQPYEVRFTSGYRPGDPRFHGQGQAIDFQLHDRKTGQALANYQDPTHAVAYQQAAQDLYRDVLKNNPALAEKMRWGGYFWNGGPGNYGSGDWMHIDASGGPTAGGNWKTGWTPQMMKAYGLSAPGGLDASPEAPAVDPYGDSPRGTTAGPPAPKPPGGSDDPMNPSSYPTTGPTTVPPAATPDDKSKIPGWQNTLGDMLAGLGSLGKATAGASASAAKDPTTLAAATMQQTGLSPIVDPQVAAQRRQDLALAMQRLNSGRLF